MILLSCIMVFWLQKYMCQSGFSCSFRSLKMGNTSSERAGLERHGHKASRGDNSGGAISTKEGDRPKILMDSPEDADLFQSEEIKVWLVLAF